LRLADVIRRCILRSPDFPQRVSFATVHPTFGQNYIEHPQKSTALNGMLYMKQGGRPLQVVRLRTRATSNVSPKNYSFFQVETQLQPTTAGAVAGAQGAGATSTGAQAAQVPQDPQETSR